MPSNSICPKGRGTTSPELSENLFSAIEERGIALGRTLTEAEQAEILDQHGDPCVVARGYQPGGHRLALGKELIGPELFPAYMMFLGFNLAVTLFTTAIIGLVVGAPVPEALAVWAAGAGTVATRGPLGIGLGTGDSVHSLAAER